MSGLLGGREGEWVCRQGGLLGEWVCWQGECLGERKGEWVVR